MGYEVPRRRFLLKFDSHPGLEVRARSVPLGTFLKITELAEKVGELDPSVLAGETTGELGDALEAVAGTSDVFTMFAGALVEWNLTDEGTPVPCTYDGLLTLDVPFAIEMLNTWMGAVGGPSGPLGARSPAGAPSPVASVPMVVASQSQAS